MKTKFILSMALMMGAMTFTSCSKDDDKNDDETAFSVIETMLFPFGIPRLRFPVILS